MIGILIKIVNPFARERVNNLLMKLTRFGTKKKNRSNLAYITQNAKFSKSMLSFPK